MFQDKDGEMQDEEETVEFVAGKLEDALPHLLAHLEHAESVITAGRLLIAIGRQLHLRLLLAV
jgi:hypothetical protein